MADISKIHSRKKSITYNVKDEVARQQVATKQDAISNISINYEEDGGLPDASVVFSEGSLNFSMKNMKMKFSELTEEEKAQLKGEKGDQGDSVILGEGDLPLTHVLGQDNTKAISQKGVSDAINDIVKMAVLNESNYNFSAKTQNRNLLPVKLEVGKSYIFEVSLEEPAVADISINLYISENNTNTYVDVGDVRQGDSNGVFEYSPLIETNYQYLGFWSNSAGNITVSYREKVNVPSMKERLDYLEVHAIKMPFNNSDIAWQRGNINNSSGVNLQSDTTVRSIGSFTISYDFNVLNNTGYNMYIFMYRMDRTYIDYRGILSKETIKLSDYTNENSVLLRIVFWNPLAAIPLEEVANLNWCIQTIPDYQSDIDIINAYLRRTKYSNADVKWQNGNINADTGANTASTTVVRTVGSITISEDFVVRNNTSYNMYLFFYEIDGTYIRLDSNIALERAYSLSGITQNQEVKVRIVFYNTSAAIPVSEAESLNWEIITIAPIEKDIQTHYTEDYSDELSIEIPIPDSLPRVDIEATRLPTKKGSAINGVLTYRHKMIFMRKKVVLDAQGNSSMAYMQKNIAIDFDDGSKIKFGNWVPQDSFHLKCYWIDVLRGYNNIALKYVEEVIKYKDVRANRNLVRITTDNSSGIFERDFDCALCHPDGFPFELYFNGSYYGLYAWNLKKHRDNYSMSKNNYSQIHLDGEIDESSLFGAVIKWTDFEIRNPKKLILMDGVTEYDGEHPAEIIGEGDPNYDENNSNHVKTAITKAAIQRLSQARTDILAASGNEARRAKFEEYFDVPMITVYVVLCNVLDNFDAFRKNWQWLCYNDIWSPNFYDMDTLFGRHFTGAYIRRSPENSLKLSADNTLMGIFYSLYESEIKALWMELRDNGMISTGYIMKYVYDWVDMVGREAYQRNIARWPQIPSYRADYPATPYTDGTSRYSMDTRGMYDSPMRIRKWLDEHIVYIDTLLGYNQ